MEIATTTYSPFASGASFVLHGCPEDQTVFQPIRNQHRWEPHLIALLERIITPDSVCLDVGANIGAITLPLAHLACRGRVHAFEASRDAVRLLEYNVAANAVSNITVVHKAITERTGNITTLYTVPSQLGTAHRSLQATHGTVSQQIETLALDDYPLERLDFMKLDIEGGEIAALAGAGRWIREHRPLLVIEYNPAPAAWFTGASKRDLYDALAGLYPHIAIIRNDGSTENISDWPMLDRELTDGVWLDLLCSF